MRAVGLLVAMTLAGGGCAITSRVAAGYGAMADSGSCGAGLTVAAVLLDGAAITALLVATDRSTGEIAAVGGLSADILIGGIEAINDCTSD